MRKIMITVQQQAELNKQLLDAAREGNTEQINKLIDKGANVNAQDTDECTPLHLAVLHGNTDTVTLLPLS